MNYKQITYDLTVVFLNFILNLFFREIRPRGSHRIPKEGPVIFVVAPHANQVNIYNFPIVLFLSSNFFLVC